jgi:hypothetical protein
LRQTHRRHSRRTKRRPKSNVNRHEPLARRGAKARAGGVFQRTNHMDNEHETRKRVADVQARLERLTAAVHRVEGERDGLLRQLLDHDGGPDSRRRESEGADRPTWDSSSPTAIRPTTIISAVIPGPVISRAVVGWPDADANSDSRSDTDTNSWPSPVVGRVSVATVCVRIGITVGRLRSDVNLARRRRGREQPED